VDIIDPYDELYQRQMDAFEEGLSARLDAIPALESTTRDAVLAYLLELACQAQNVRNIVLGRTALLGLPRDWLLLNIEHYAEPLLQLGEEWEYRRLGELYAQVDNELLRRLVDRGFSSRDEAIRQAAQDLGSWLAQ